MSGLRSPRLSSPWPAAKAAPLPAAAAALLALALATQLAVSPVDPELTPDIPAMAIVRSPSFVIEPVAPGPEIMRTPLFAPNRQAAGGAAGAAVQDFVLLGTVVSRRGASAAIRFADGRVTTVGVGEHIGRWRLRMIARNRAGFESAGGLRTLIVGAGGTMSPAPAPAPATEGDP